jgi:hypothetical protein
MLRPMSHDGWDFLVAQIDAVYPSGDFRSLLTAGVEPHPCKQVTAYRGDEGLDDPRAGRRRRRADDARPARRRRRRPAALGELMRGPFGTLRFLQIVGLTADELECTMTSRARSPAIASCR